MKKQAFWMAATAAALGLALLLAACGGGSSGGSSKTHPDIAIEENASVHDPSVFYDEASGTYYAFGSHFAVASSTDLVNWRQVAGDLEEGELLLYGTTDWRSAIPQCDALIGGDWSTWAPDVDYYDGKYYMYFALTSGGMARSVIGRVESGNVLGPYSNDVIVVESATSRDMLRPNCIDPELFYDKEGGLWMVYGSFFGGIFMLELYNSGDEWGLPKPDQGFGTRVWMGGEGAYVFYNKDTDYYYLLTSHGDLAADYNIRVARSKSPNGPYLGITGANVAIEGEEAYKFSGNYFVGNSEGIAAIGHGSVVEKDGEFFSVSHSRREDKADRRGVSPGHSMWSAKILFNEDGWPLLSPCRYTGEKARSFAASELAGTYDALFFPNVTTKAFTQSSELVFKRDGTITEDGRDVGSYEVSGGNYITLAFDGIEYKGAIADCWNTYTNAGGAICVSAVAADTATAFWAVGR